MYYRKFVEMIYWLTYLKKFFFKTKVSYSFIILYDDKVLPWLRKFILLWLLILFYTNLTLYFEIIPISWLQRNYYYELTRFWVFYIPVFGLFVKCFYNVYSSDNWWALGPFIYIYNYFIKRDFF